VTPRLARSLAAGSSSCPEKPSGHKWPGYTKTGIDEVGARRHILRIATVANYPSRRWSRYIRSLCNGKMIPNSATNHEASGVIRHQPTC
jgi:hypothetical protein